MRKVLNYGSINIDYVYGVSHFVKPGETLSSQSYAVFLGGKGCNQSVALAKAGATVFHAGNIHNGDHWIIQQLKEWNVQTAFIAEGDTATGHAIIQVNSEGENAIIIHGGANHLVTSHQVDAVFAHFEAGDVLVLQNEVNNLPVLIDTAHAKGLKIVFNPAPMTAKVLDYPLDKISLLVVNETEGKALAGMDTTTALVDQLHNKYKGAAILLTLGKNGAIYKDESVYLEQKARVVTTKDTTAAGDTFIGYFVAKWLEDQSISDCLEWASAAAALAVTKKGGAISIPDKPEVESFLQQ